MITSMCAPTWHDDVCTCTLAQFVPYPLHKFRLTLSSYYLWQWHISVLTLYHSLSADYVCVRLVNFFFFSLCLKAAETFCLPFPLSPCCILYCLLLSPCCIRFFLLLSPCLTQFLLGLTKKTHYQHATATATTHRDSTN